MGKKKNKPWGDLVVVRMLYICHHLFKEYSLSTLDNVITSHCNYFNVFVWKLTAYPPQLSHFPQLLLLKHLETMYKRVRVDLWIRLMDNLAERFSMVLTVFHSFCSCLLWKIHSYKNDVMTRTICCPNSKGTGGTFQSGRQMFSLCISLPPQKKNTHTKISLSLIWFNSKRDTQKPFETFKASL